MAGISRPSEELIAATRKHLAATPPINEIGPIDLEVEKLVSELIGRVADRWTLEILDVLAEHGELRFTKLGKLVNGISQKMLTKTVRQMERDGLVKRTIYPVIPPRVEYKLTDMGFGLSAAFCGVWIWAADHLEAVSRARKQFDLNVESLKNL